jgi:hypothetical protein
VAVVALVAAWMPRPPRALVRAVLLAALASIVGPLFSALTSTVPWSEIEPLKKGLWLDGLLALALLSTSVLRANLAPLPRRYSDHHSN